MSLFIWLVIIAIVLTVIAFVGLFMLVVFADKVLGVEDEEADGSVQSWDTSEWSKGE